MHHSHQKQPALSDKVHKVQRWMSDIQKNLAMSMLDFLGLNLTWPLLPKIHRVAITESSSTQFSILDYLGSQGMGKGNFFNFAKLPYFLK